MDAKRFVQRNLEADEPFRRITVAEARRLIEHEGVCVVDVRSPAEFARGHIPGAVNVAVDDLYQNRAKLALDGKIVLVCRIGVVSALGAEILAALGSAQLYNLEGGMEYWIGCQYPIECSPIPPQSRR